VAALIGVAASNLNAYLNDNKDWVAQQIEGSLERPVAFDSVGLSLTRGLAVEVHGFRIAEDTRFGEGDFLSVGKAEVSVAIWPALFGKIEITKISFRDVDVTVVQAANGLSTDSLGGSSEANPEPEVVEPVDSETAESEPGMAETLIVAMAEIRSGRIRYIDRTTNPPREVVIDHLEFSTSDVGLTRPLDFQLLGELLGEQDSNLRIQGNFGPLPTTAGAPTPLDINFSLDPIQVSRLAQLPGLGDALDPTLPLEGTMNLSGSVRGSLETPEVALKLDATDALVVYAEDGRKDRGSPFGIGVDVALVGETLEIRDADFEIEGVELHASGKVVNLADPIVHLVVDVFGGNVTVDGGWSTETGALNLDAKLVGVELGQIASQLGSGSVKVLDGRLTMTLALKGIGKTWEELKPGLQGVGEAKIDGGVLHDINLVEEALAGFTGVPGLSAKLGSKMAKKYPALFSTGNTEFDSMHGKVEVSDGQLSILGMEFDAGEFALNGEGTVSLDGVLDMVTHVVLSEALTDDLIDEAKVLKHLRAKNDRIEIPVRIGGSLSDISMKPDTQAIVKTLGAGASKGLVNLSIGKLVKKQKKKKGDSPASADGGRELLQKLLR
jgi:uncharacterized protein involved in outer membrane biogenesis